MTYIHADLGAMADAVGQYASIRNAYDSTLAELEAQLATSLSQWSGEAQQAYAAAQQEWTQTSQNMSATLDWLRYVIQNAHGNYSNALTATITMWGGS